MMSVRVETSVGQLADLTITRQHDTPGAWARYRWSLVRHDQDTVRGADPASAGRWVAEVVGACDARDRAARPDPGGMMKQSPRDDPRTDRSIVRRHPDWIVGRRVFPIISGLEPCIPELGWTRIPWESPDGLTLVDVPDGTMVDADGMSAVWHDRRWKIVDWMDLRHDMTADEYLDRTR